MAAYIQPWGWIKGIVPHWAIVPVCICASCLADRPIITGKKHGKIMFCPDWHCLYLHICTVEHALSHKNTLLLLWCSDHAEVDLFVDPKLFRALG